jgi:hypothetical protein
MQIGIPKISQKGIKKKKFFQVDLAIKFKICLK